MEIVAKIFYWIVLFWVWFLLIKHRRTVKSWTGNFYWAEHYLWRGSTYFVIILIWLFCMFLWILYPFWWMELIFWAKPDISTLKK